MIILNTFGHDTILTGNFIQDIYYVGKRKNEIGRDAIAISLEDKGRDTKLFPYNKETRDMDFERLKEEIKRYDEILI